MDFFNFCKNNKTEFFVSLLKQIWKKINYFSTPVYWFSFVKNQQFNLLINKMNKALSFTVFTVNCFVCF